MATYFTSDTHFGHGNVMRYCKRPFSSVKEMNEVLFENWARVVRPTDAIYHLGDVLFGRTYEELTRLLECVRKLPGRKYLVPGNHDERYLSVLGWAFQEILPPIADLVLQRKIHGQVQPVRLVLCHYPMFSWKRSRIGRKDHALQLYGHVHVRYPGTCVQTDVGVDAWEYKPVGIEELLARMATLSLSGFPDNAEEEECQETAD